MNTTEIITVVDHTYINDYVSLYPSMLHTNDSFSADFDDDELNIFVLTALQTLK